MEELIRLLDAQDVAVLAFVILVNERVFDLLAERLIKPLFVVVEMAMPDWASALNPGQYTLTLLSWVAGGLLAWATGINLLKCCLLDPWGQVMTCLVAGGGSNLLHSLFGMVEAVKVRARNGAG